MLQRGAATALRETARVPRPPNSAHPPGYQTSLGGWRGRRRVSAAEQEKSRAFIDKLIELDEEETLYNLLWDEFSASIRILLNNPYVFAPFWEYQQGNKTDEEWQKAFEMAKKSANHALGAKDAGKVLGLVLSRLYTLRNQLVHGGATWGSDVNRDQLRDSTRFLGKLVPKIIELMMDNPNTLWGDPTFPVVS